MGFSKYVAEIQIVIVRKSGNRDLLVHLWKLRLSGGEITADPDLRTERNPREVFFLRGRRRLPDKNIGNIAFLSAF